MHDAALACLDEGDERFDPGIWRDLLADRGDGLLRVEIRAVDELVGFAQGADDFRVEASAFHADLVDAADFGGIAVCDHEWRHVLHELRAAAGDGVPADATELVDA